MLKGYQGNASQERIAKNNALIAYILMGLGFFTGIFWLIGVIWAMAKKSEAVGTSYYDHYQNISYVFWWSIGWSLIGVLLLAVAIGYLILFAVWIWSIYRIVKGIARVTSDKGYAD
ncbi:hypothetical protein N9R79_00565 [Vibrio sp.]|nr:hypothetical protein [Vibrio sp.]